MPAFPSAREPMETLERKNFLLLRHGRSVIQDGAQRDRLEKLPRIVNLVCPLQELLFRRAGIRW